ncbi:putative reverse transcriptase domain-containing protein, partial [Tanacetum coccineum]
MPLKRTSAAATAAAAAPMTAIAVEQLIESRVSAALANHETLRNSTNGHGDGSHNSGTGTRGSTCTPQLALICGRMFHKESEEVDKYVGGLPDMIRGNFSLSLKDKLSRRGSWNLMLGIVKGTNNKTRGRTLGELTLLGLCKKVGHMARDYRSTGPNGNNNNRGNSKATQNAITCYECGVQGHYKKDYLKLKNGNHGNQRGNDNAPAK